MGRKRSPWEAVEWLVSEEALVRPRDATRHGISRQYLEMAAQLGFIQRVGPGLYAPKGAKISALARAVKLVPNGIVCLLSALRFHGLLADKSPKIWLAIAHSARAPKRVDLRLQIVRFSGAALSEGVETHLVDGLPVRVYGVAKTIADCFKYRNKIGSDIGVRALKKALANQCCSLAQLQQYASVCRVSKSIGSALLEP